MRNESDIPEILTKRDLFLEMVQQKIWATPSNFSESYSALTSPVDQKEHRRAAGVLFPLLFPDQSQTNIPTEQSFAVVLVKRSFKVAQAGDLSFPGGMLDDIRDRVLRFPFAYGPFSLVKQEARKFLNRQDKATARLITLFMTTAFRESWEEIRLSPFQARFLGTLPTRNLSLFARTIFPIVGFVENEGRLHPNEEVEKIVTIPLASFYRRDLLCRLQIDPWQQTGDAPYYPCLVHRNSDGQEEVLWGATFSIILEFLRITMDYHPPDWKTKRLIAKRLTSAYLSGNSER
jgi:8-oxo-dGTP pyrophosphatase MutT (NUDIX family)